MSPRYYCLLWLNCNTYSCQTAYYNLLKDTQDQQFHLMFKRNLYFNLLTREKTFKSLALGFRELKINLPFPLFAPLPLFPLDEVWWVKGDGDWKCKKYSSEIFAENIIFVFRGVCAFYFKLKVPTTKQDQKVYRCDLKALQALRAWVLYIHKHLVLYLYIKDWTFSPCLV